jgi:5-methylthioadenosine/S-adenosylhomocysteine deaminase
MEIRLRDPEFAGSTGDEVEQMSRRRFIQASGIVAGGLALGGGAVHASPDQATTADVLIHGAVVVTMDAKRSVFRDGAVAIKNGAIAEVGSSPALLARWSGTQKIDLSGLVVTPGLINAHMHTTGDALFPGFRPDDSVPTEHLTKWALPAYEHSRPEDDRAAARFIALQMVRQGTTAFIEASTCRHPAAVLEGLTELGIRGSIGTWAGDRWPDSGYFSSTTQQAIRRIHDTMALPSSGLIQIWPNVLGTAICSDELYVAAAKLAREHNRQWTFHMSPDPNDITAYRKRTGVDPLVHLERLGVLDSRCVIAHAIHITEAEVAAISRSGATVVFCAHSAMRNSSGVTRVGRHPDLSHVALGTDAVNACNHLSLLDGAAMTCHVYAEARKSYATVTAERALEWLILGGARALNLSDRIGSLEAGKRADIAAFDVGAPRFNIANALVYGYPRAVHVFIEGKQIMRDGHVKGEEEILREASRAARRVAERAGLPLHTGWKLSE